jgi:hypothetical protein
MVSAVLLAFALASLSHYYPEKFFRSAPSIVAASSRRVIAYGVCALAACCYWASSMFDQQYRYSLSTNPLTRD